MSCSRACLALIVDPFILLAFLVKVSSSALLALQDFPKPDTGHGRTDLSRD